MTELVPIIVVAVTAIAGLIAYTFQKWLDRKNALSDLRRSAYQEVISALQVQLHLPSNEHLAALSSSRAKAFIVASDEVALAMGQFIEIAVDATERQISEGTNVLEAYARMVIAMRRDCFEKTKLSPDQVVKVSPVVWREK